MGHYEAARPLMRPGDLLAFWGSERDPVSLLIEEATEYRDASGKRQDGPSHVALIRQPWIPPADPKAIECTLNSACNGVRTIGLPELLAEYPAGSRAALYPLTPSARAMLDLRAFYAKCGALDGGVKYDIPALFRFLLPGALQNLLDPNVEHAHAMVCSICAAVILRDSGVLPGINPERTRPTDLILRPEFGAPVGIWEPKKAAVSGKDQA